MMGSPLTPQVSWESRSPHHNNQQIGLHINTQKNVYKENKGKILKIMCCYT